MNSEPEDSPCHYLCPMRRCPSVQHWSQRTRSVSRCVITRARPDDQSVTVSFRLNDHVVEWGQVTSPDAHLPLWPTDVPPCCMHMQVVAIVGSIPELGGWDIKKAPRMNW